MAITENNPLVLEAMRSCGIKPEIRGSVKQFAEHIGVSEKTLIGWKNNKLPDLAEWSLKMLIENNRLKTENEKLKDGARAVKKFIEMVKD